MRRMILQKLSLVVIPLRSPAFWIAAILFVVAGLLFASAIITLRVNTYIAKGDAQYAQSRTPKGTSPEEKARKTWGRLETFPASWVIEYGQASDDFLFRRAVLLVNEEKYEEAVPLLAEVAQSDDPLFVSLAATLLGKIFAQEAFLQKGLPEETKAELFEMATRLFAAAAVLDVRNEDAKFNLELMLSQSGLREGEGEDGDTLEELVPGLPKPNIPGDEDGFGSNDPYYGY